MAPTEVAGNWSGFQEQISSTRKTAPKHGIGKGGRTLRIYEPAMEVMQKGTEAPPAHYNFKSGFGEQTLSERATQPKYSMGVRCAIGSDPARRDTTPGPGAHGAEMHLESALHQQARSTRRTEPTTRFGRDGRFHVPRGGVMESPCPGQMLPRPRSGWLGEYTPKYSFYCPAKRYEMGKGLNGQVPTPYTTPGAKYKLDGAMGPQTLSTRPSEPRNRIGSAPREKIEKQYLSAGHATFLFGRTGPGPVYYEVRRKNGAIGEQINARVSTKPSWGFGSGDRFAQAKPRPKTAGSVTDAHFCVPAPGTYRIQ